MEHIYIFLSIFFGVTSQLIIKWRMTLAGSLPDDAFAKIIFLIKAFFDPYVIISIFLTLLAGITWMAAMTKYEISYAYPFMSLSFILILIFSALLFNEPINIFKIIGLIIIIIGIIISSR